jgi:hypothetical protein
MTRPQEPFLSTYRTFVADILGILNPALFTQVQAELQGLFAGCPGTSFSDNTVVVADASNMPSGPELLVYFIGSRLSIVKQVPSIVDLSFPGWTVHEVGASEVRVTSASPAALARLAFHELMHNRLKQDDDKLHPQGGLAGKIVGATTALSPANAAAMSAVISNPISQWTAGIGILASGKNDPLSEYYTF